VHFKPRRRPFFGPGSLSSGPVFFCRAPGRPVVLVGFSFSAQKLNTGTYSTSYPMISKLLVISIRPLAGPQRSGISSTGYFVPPLAATPHLHTNETTTRRQITHLTRDYTYTPRQHACKVDAYLNDWIFNHGFQLTYLLCISLPSPHPSHSPGCVHMICTLFPPIHNLAVFISFRSCRVKSQIHILRYITETRKKNKNAATVDLVCPQSIHPFIHDFNLGATPSSKHKDVYIHTKNRKKKKTQHSIQRRIVTLGK
jgi:hypothetical protein